MSFHMFVENEAGSNHKNRYDERTLTFVEYGTVARAYPFPYGFILGTRNADGDCLDCFVVTERALRPGDIVECEAIGLMEQTEDGLPDGNVLARLLDERPEVTDRVRSTLTAFVREVFSDIPGKAIQVGRFFGSLEAEIEVERCRLPAESLDQKIARVSAEAIEIVPYDPRWPGRFTEEKAHLLAILPGDLIGRIEHIGSTAVPGLAAKPIVDMLVEVTSLEAAKSRIVPLLEARGYDYFWRETRGASSFYAWFIARDPITRARTHHIHMVERAFPNWDALRFRDYLLGHPDVAQQYLALKLELASRFRNDREAYTEGKGAFIAQVMELAARA